MIGVLPKTQWPYVNRGHAMAKQLRSFYNFEGQSYNLLNRQNDLTPTSPTWGDQTPFGKGMRAPVTNEILATDTLMNNTNFTFSWWGLWRPALNNLALFRSLITGADTNIFFRQVVEEPSFSGVACNYRLASGGGTKTIRWAIATGRDHHLNLVWVFGDPYAGDSTASRLYGNGALRDTAEWDSSGILNTGFLRWKFNDGDAHTNNPTNFVAVWDRGLSAAEVAQHYRTFDPFVLPKPQKLRKIKTTLGDPTVMSVFPYHELSRPTAIAHEWKDVIDAPGLETTDNSASDITNPSTQIGVGPGLTRHVLKVAKRGTFLQLRLAYDDELTGLTDPVVQIFGRFDENDQWQRLKNLSDSVDVTVITSTSLDVTDGTLKYSDPGSAAQTIDLSATDELLIGIKTALAGTGVTSNAKLQAKLIGGIRSF